MDEFISKSQKKRDAEFLQKIGVQLIDLSLEKLDSLPLVAPLKEAVLTAKRLKSHGAVRRQAQLIGKLMRKVDAEEIIAGLDALEAEDSAKTQNFHHLEVWRSRLLSNDKTAITEFLSNYPTVDSQQLRQLIKKAIAERDNVQSLGASKTLWRFLRSNLQ